MSTPQEAIDNLRNIVVDQASQIAALRRNIEILSAANGQLTATNNGLKQSNEALQKEVARLTPPQDEAKVTDTPPNQ